MQPVKSYSDLSEAEQQAIIQEQLDNTPCEAVSWQDLNDSATILPDLETEGRHLILNYLGYLPAPHLTLPHEPFIRSIIQGVRQGTVSRDEAFEVVEHIKQIRNSDMKHNPIGDYEPSIYKTYQHYYTPYGQMARERLVKFLRYEPELIHSILAELWLREVMARDTLHLPGHMTEIDYRAITLVKYREVLLADGKEAADASPLIRHSQTTG